MKKHLLALALSMLTLSAVSALEANVSQVTGKVEVQRGSVWVAVKAGDTLQKGSVIQTGFNSGATLTINGTTVTVGALTRMTIEQLAAGSAKDETQIFLDSGKVQADVQHTENRRTDFKVRSPVATASVRGTKIEMYADGDFRVMEGMADYGPAESGSPRIQEDAPSEDDGEPDAPGASTVFTPAHDIGGTYGTPVFAGWSSSTDTTGARQDPQERLAQGSQNLGGQTATLSEREATSAPAGKTAGGEQSQPQAAETATVTVRLTFSNEY